MGLGRPVRLLIVDDDPEYLELAALTLKDIGMPTEMRTAGSGTEAWKKLQDFDPDLVLLDLKISGVYGTEICAKMKKSARWARAKVFVLTSYATCGVRKMVMDCGADDLMHKPYDADELRRRAEKLLASEDLRLEGGSA